MSWTWDVEVEHGEYFGIQTCYAELCARIMEIARDFPNCDAVAVDLVPMQSP